MEIMTLPVSDYLDQIFRHPLPELMDEECLKGLQNIKKAHRNRQSHMTGLEVRLTREERFVDFIEFIDDDSVYSTQGRWTEIDYDSFRNGGDPDRDCSFINLDKEYDDSLFDRIFPEFTGEKRAGLLGPSFRRTVESLPEGAWLKQIGCMESRGEQESVRLVIFCEDRDTIRRCLKSIGWKGNPENVYDALIPWDAYDHFGLNLDLTEEGTGEKLGIEVFLKWHNPILVDIVIDRLVYQSLCLPDKAEAVKRWIRILPEGEPFIQTRFTYFKLNYSDGSINEAKAYLEQRPFILHYYFPAYDRPLRLDLELSGRAGRMDAGKALELIDECLAERIPCVRLYGAEEYTEARKLVRTCSDKGLRTEIVINRPVPRETLESLYKAGATDFRIHIGDDNGACLKTIELLKDFEGIKIRIILLIHRDNADSFEEFLKSPVLSGVSELCLTSVLQYDDMHLSEQPDMDQMERLITLIRDHEGDFPVTADSCFSKLKAMLGGKDAKRNCNQGVERGCEAGRSFFAVLSDGSFVPCLRLRDMAESGKVGAYWDDSPAIKEIRKRGEHREECSGCMYERRCLPCPGIKYECEKIYGGGNKNDIQR